MNEIKWAGIILVMAVVTSCAIRDGIREEKEDNLRVQSMTVLERAEAQKWREAS